MIAPFDLFSVWWTLQQQARERIRLQAGERFARGEKTAVVAAELRVGVRQVEKWRCRRREGGLEALRSAGPMSVERLSPAQWERLVRELAEGPLVHCWDQGGGWPLGRVKTMIGRLFHVGYTVQGIWRLLRRHGWSLAGPGPSGGRARRRGGRGLARGGLALGKRLAADLGAVICFEDEAGQGLRPPRGRSWAPRGQTPVFRVRGGRDGWVSMAGVLCFRPGERPHLLYRLRLWHGRKGERRGFTWSEYRDLIVATHHRLNAPLVWIWDNLNVHKAHEMVEFIDANRDWLRVVHLPSYAPDLNPTEGVWSLLKRSLTDFAAADLDHLTRVVKRKLKKIQYRPDVLNGCLTQTGLTITTTP